MSITKSELMKLQNGSDVRGIACEGIEGEHVTLTSDAAVYGYPATDNES